MGYQTTLLMAVWSADHVVVNFGAIGTCYDLIPTQRREWRLRGRDGIMDLFFDPYQTIEVDDTGRGIFLDIDGNTQLIRFSMRSPMTAKDVREYTGGF